MVKSGENNDDTVCEKFHTESSGNIDKEGNEKSANNHNPNTSQSSKIEVQKEETRQKSSENGSKNKNQIKHSQKKFCLQVPQKRCLQT